jgi:hypothetical protein
VPRALMYRVVRAVPLIERLENVALMPAEMKSPGHGHSAMASILLSDS